MRRLVPLLLALLTLAGCRGSGYYQKRSHYSQRSDIPAAAADSGAISSRDALYQAIKNAVDARKGREELIIQGYDGDWESDLDEIRREIREVYPYGAYAVESIDSISSQVYTQTKANLTIKYWDSAAELKDIPHVVSMSDFERRVAALLESFTVGPGSDDSANQAFVFGSFSDEDALLAQRLLKCWAQKASCALDLRDISGKAYPPDAQACIIEVTIQYLETQEVLLEKSAAVQAAAREIAQGFDGETDRDKVDFVYRWLWENVEYDRGDFSGMPQYGRNTAYGGLMERSAFQSGYALTAQALCQALELDSQVVIGEVGGQSDYYWLVLTLDGATTHFDPAAMRDDEAVLATTTYTEESGGDGEEESLAVLGYDYSGHIYLFDQAAAQRRFSWNETLYNLGK